MDGFAVDAELALTRLAAIVQSSHDAVIGKSLTGVIESWNPGAERLYGWSASEAVGQGVSLLVPEDQQPVEDELMAAIGRGEQVEAVQVQRRHRDGRRLLVSLSMSMSPILDRDGVIVGVASSSRDAGKRRRWQDRSQRMLDAAPDAMLGVDEHGMIVFVTAQVQGLFGYPAAELLGTSVDLLLPPPQRPGHAGLRAGYAGNPVPRAMGAGWQLFAQRHDGSVFPADMGSEEDRYRIWR